ncbi:MAG: hypothetical protein OEZ29_01435 [Candidatus Bathyarchaeota archaeon]|nr:hypothetical protein [Candidatus Bathyarchaeota archaeon]MDH5779239.1 hypothetical protein [Candidatus Bathyarchaeota archaeon]
MSFLRRQDFQTGVIVSIVIILLLTHYLTDFGGLRQFMDETTYTSFHMVCGLILSYTIFIAEATKKEEKKETSLIISEENS